MDWYFGFFTPADVRRTDLHTPAGANGSGEAETSTLVLSLLCSLTGVDLALDECILFSPGRKISNANCWMMIVLSRLIP